MAAESLSDEMALSLARQLIKLDEEVVALLCCPLCKGPLARRTGQLECRTCGSNWPTVQVPGGDVYDFRIIRPVYIELQSERRWQGIQAHYEDWSEDEARRYDVPGYLDEEIGSVREIYEQEFCLEGRILDVGGHQGRLRHYLRATKVSLYVVADPFIEVFRGAVHPNLLRAYPCLAKPVNFVGAQAEFLPFRSGSFDWVHMRSVVDHFVDPWFALKEAWRVLRPGGRVLVGLSIAERIANSRPAVLERLRRKLAGEGAAAVLRAVVRRALDATGYRREDHMWHLTADEIRDLCHTTGFSIVKEHWQKPPYQYVLYLEAMKRDVKVNARR